MSPEIGHRSDDRGKPGKFGNEYCVPHFFLGCRVESSRDSWPLDEIAGKGLIDFGKAKAEVPGAGGRWRLEGFLQADTMKKVFIGRNAELYNPSGKLVVKAADLIVPADAPDRYQVVKK